jgi:hypothetical protein
MEHYVIVSLLTYLIVREAIFLYSTNKLVNKLMSRDYHSYQMSEKVGKLEAPKPPKEEDLSLAEDMNVIF